MNKCTTCGTAMKDLFSSRYCPNEEKHAALAEAQCKHRNTRWYMEPKKQFNVRMCLDCNQDTTGLPDLESASHHWGGSSWCSHLNHWQISGPRGDLWFCKDCGVPV